MLLKKDTDEIQHNLKEFINKYGEEGFLELYFTNFLFEIVKDNIRSKAGSISKSPGLQYFFNKEGEFESTTKLKEFDIRLKKECNKKSKEIVNLIKQRELLSKFGVDINKITTSLSVEMDKQIKDIFKKVIGVEWGKKADEQA